MNKTQSCLSREILDQIGRDEILPNELQRIEDHVSECEHCRELFATVTAEPDWTDRILPVLRERRGAMPGIVEGDQSCGDDTVLSLLGPTDDPRMLGRIGTYEVTGVIGRGGMGIVFKAFDASLNRFVAIKMLLPHLATSGAARKRFSREGRAAAAVVDDHVLPIYGVNEWQGVPYLVIQYSSGMSLEKRIQDQAPLALTEILRISLQTARGLAAAHAQGLVHRDVKPSNILLDGTVERALLTDFGLARTVDDASITRSGTIAGTPQFMAPEQARGESVDQRSDLFSLGAVMYAMCTGHPPFRADSSYGVLRRIIDEEPRPIREINSDIPEWLCNIIARLMAKQPEERFSSAAEAADLLAAWLAHIQQPAVISPPERIAQTQASNNGGKRSRPFRYLAGAGFAFFLLFAGIIIVLELNKGQNRIQSDADDIPIRITQNEKLNASVHHNFASDGLPLDRFAVRGDYGSEHIATKPDGLHVTHPGRAGFSNSSVQVQLRAHGDFEITATFQNLSIDPGDDGSAGLSITAVLDNADHTHGTVYRGALSEPGGPVLQIVQSELLRNPKNERIAVWRGTTPEEATSGRFRLSRVGETLYCLFAPGDSPQFRLIHTENVGKESLLFGGVRLEAAVQSRGSTPGTTSVVWKDVTIRAERITDWAD